MIKLVHLIDLGGKVHLADKVRQSFWMIMLFCCMVVLVDLSAKVKVNMVDLVGMVVLVYLKMEGVNGARPREA